MARAGYDIPKNLQAIQTAEDEDRFIFIVVDGARERRIDHRAPSSLQGQKACFSRIGAPQHVRVRTKSRLLAVHPARNFLRHAPRLSIRVVVVELWKD